MIVSKPGFHRGYFLLGILTFTLITSSFLILASQTTRDLPYDVHLNWQDNTSTTMSVVWETTPATTGSTVKYGPDSGYGQTATGTTDSQGTNGLIHMVEITGLSPGTTYHYSCGDATGGWSPDSTFTTSPATATNFTFISMGDSRDNPTELQKIVGKVIIVNPDFVGFSGDLVGSDDATLYDGWFTIWQPLGNHVPIVPSIGNHEESGVNYIHRFTLPNNERWYSLNYSNMHIIVLSTSQDTYSTGSEQYNWLVHDLQVAANDSAHPWKIAIFHNPPYNVGGHGGDAGVQTYLVPLFLQYKVDIVFNGHNHYYERTYPLAGGGSNPTVTNHSLHYYRNPTGVIYATTGSCGAPLYDIGSAYYLAVAVKNYNYARINVFTNNSLHMVTYLDDGTTVIDNFWIDKGGTTNMPPTTPVVTGPSWGLVNTSVTFSANATDPDGDDVWCQWDWGDGNVTGWLGPNASGSTVTATHAWPKVGVYGMRVRLKDTYSQESNWSDPWSITIHELWKTVMFGSYANWTLDKGFVTVNAVNIRALELKPLKFTHYHSHETLVFSEEYSGRKTGRFLIGIFNLVD